jgi:ribonuclease-3
LRSSRRPRTRGRSSPLERVLGIRFKNRAIRESALTHRSFAFERNTAETNERLEFLGDAVLGLVVTDLAYRRFPKMPEGELAKLRAATVNMLTLADVARELDLGSAILLGKGEEQSGGRDKTSILADAMEAVLGGVYVDRGLDAARDLIERLFWPRMEAYVRGEGDRDHKTALQELAAQDVGQVPQYRVEQKGPDHAKEFTATVLIAGERYGLGRGRSKKEAEQRAARQAYERLVAEVASEEAGEA